MPRLSRAGHRPRAGVADCGRGEMAAIAVIPYILRLELLKLDGMWAQYSAVADWWTRMRTRSSVKSTIFDRMEDKDWAPFKNLAPDPWPKVQELLKAAA